MSTLYGPVPEPTGTVDLTTHEHDYVPWSSAPGSDVHGFYCHGCGDLQID